MEPQQNEVNIENIDTTQIICGTIEEDTEELSGNSGKVEGGIFGGGDGG